MTVKGLMDCLKALPPDAELALEESTTKGRYNLVFVKPLEIAFSGIPNVFLARAQTVLPLQPKGEKEGLEKAKSAVKKPKSDAK